MRHIKYGRFLTFSVAAIMLLMAGCAGYSKDPEIKSYQIWADSCETYTQTLSAVNDMIELQMLTTGQIDGVRNIRNAVGPLCEMKTPPMSGDRRALQALIDAELLRLIKIKKGIE